MNRDKVELPAWLNVSRETLDRLFSFCDLVEKWNPAINLISKSGIAEIWNRHIIDSAQLFQQMPDRAREWCDLGSGGGFPGIVLAILAKQLQPNAQVILVESDRRKSVFLAQASRLLDIDVRVKTQRIEELEPQNADVLSARALAPMSDLCGYAYRHLKPDGVAIFPKGAAALLEIEQAQKLWRFDYSLTQSYTDPTAHILSVRGIRRA